MVYSGGCSVNLFALLINIAWDLLYWHSQHTGIQTYKYNIFILMPKQTFISCSVFHYIFNFFLNQNSHPLCIKATAKKKIIKRNEINFRNSVRYSRVAFNILKIYNTIWIKGCTILARSFLMLKDPHSAD